MLSLFNKNTLKCFVDPWPIALCKRANVWCMLYAILAGCYWLPFADSECTSTIWRDRPISEAGWMQTLSSLDLFVWLDSPPILLNGMPLHKSQTNIIRCSGRPPFALTTISAPCTKTPSTLSIPFESLSLWDALCSGGIPGTDDCELTVNTIVIRLVCQYALYCSLCPLWGNLGSLYASFSGEFKHGQPL